MFKLFTIYCNAYAAYGAAMRAAQHDASLLRAAVNAEDAANAAWIDFSLAAHGMLQVNASILNGLQHTLWQGEPVKLSTLFSLLTVSPN